MKFGDWLQKNQPEPQGSFSSFLARKNKSQPTAADVRRVDNEISRRQQQETEEILRQPPVYTGISPEETADTDFTPVDMGEGTRSTGQKFVDAVTAVPRVVVGVGENVLAGATGLGASAVGGGAGLARGGLEKIGGNRGFVETAVPVIETAQQKFTYQPRTLTGQRIQQVMGKIPSVVQGGGDVVFDATGSPVAGAGAQTILTGLGLALGVRGAQAIRNSRDWNKVYDQKEVLSADFRERAKRATPEDRALLNSVADRMDAANTAGELEQLFTGRKYDPLAVVQSRANPTLTEPEAAAVRRETGLIAQDRPTVTGSIGSAIKEDLGSAVRQQTGLTRSVIDATVGDLLPESVKRLMVIGLRGGGYYATGGLAAGVTGAALATRMLRGTSRGLEKQRAAVAERDAAQVIQDLVQGSPRTETPGAPLMEDSGPQETFDALTDKEQRAVDALAELKDATAAAAAARTTLTPAQVETILAKHRFSSADQVVEAAAGAMERGRVVDRTVNNSSPAIDSMTQTLTSRNSAPPPGVMSMMDDSDKTAKKLKKNPFDALRDYLEEAVPAEQNLRKNWGQPGSEQLERESKQRRDQILRDHDFESVRELEQAVRDRGGIISSSGEDFLSPEQIAAMGARVKPEQKKFWDGLVEKARGGDWEALDRLFGYAGKFRETSAEKKAPKSPPPGAMSMMDDPSGYKAPGTTNASDSMDQLFKTLSKKSYEQVRDILVNHKGSRTSEDFDKLIANTGWTRAELGYENRIRYILDNNWKNLGSKEDEELRKLSPFELIKVQNELDANGNEILYAIKKVKNDIARIEALPASERIRYDKEKNLINKTGLTSFNPRV